MKKNLLKVICTAFIAMLCVGTLNAQDLRGTTATACQLPLEQVVSYLPSDLATPSMDMPVLSSSRGNIARGTKNYVSSGSTGYIQFDCENIMGNTIISSMTAYGAGYLNGTLYNYKTNSDSYGYATDTYYQIVNPETGVVTTTIERTELYGVVVGSLCYDYTSSTMYAMKGATGNNKLCTVNLETGQLTEIVTISGDAAANMLLGMAIDLSGNMFAITAAPSAISNLYSINKTTGVSTLIGATGKAANYAQSISFDYNDANCPLYWAQISSTTDLNWMKLNVTSGAATIITANIGMEVCGLYFPYTPSGYDPCPVVTNVTATQHVGTSVKITWTAPTDLTNFIEYKIYDGSTVLGTAPSGTTTFITDPLAAGAHTFAVEATYTGDCIPKKVTTDLTIKTCGEAIKGVAVEYNDCKATVTWTAAAKSKSSVLFDGGPFITHPGQGYGGADAAGFAVATQNSYGATAIQSAGWIIADDFILTAQSTIETIEFYTYQTGSGLTPTITGVYVCIYDGNPMSGGNIIWGDQTTNRMSTVSFSSFYRVNFTTLTNTDRPLMKVTANIGGFDLAPGTYWVGVSYNGTVSSGPWQNPVNVLGQPQTGNGLQFVPPAGANPGWNPWADSGTNEQCALPFVMYGEGGEPPVVKYNVYMDGVLVADGIEETTYTHPTAVAQGVDVVWCVAQACPYGGESEAGCVAEKCGNTPPPPCEKVTGAKAEIGNGCTEATITWTAVEGAKGYKIKGTAGETTVTAPPYIETVDYLENITYIWKIITVCEENESDAVEVSATATDCVGISEFGNTISIYPNPVNNGSVNITAANFAKVEVYSSIGQLIVSQNTTTVDVSNYQAGVYFFKVFDTNNNTAMKRISVIK